ncbi:expressed unknown protein [Seminavis robusta]|uniref:Uncharacterized protein n=1 Tax=Seminavis robusta TaxID=568900 RepID=A0A9N8EJH3_9STRA|nr:expressed unknown protein [Seminavis robusta]|eukprot:Sro1200_g251820.1 n/a (170) ;mRNA; f:3131-3640
MIVHFPDVFGANGMSWDGLVSTIDIVPTTCILDYAGVADYYDMDGKSWKNAVQNSARLEFWRDERCLVFELDRDRAVRCGCDKYMELPDLLQSEKGRINDDGVYQDEELLFNVCDDTGVSVPSGAASPEVNDLKSSKPGKHAAMKSILYNHIEYTQADNDPMEFTPIQP